MASAKCPISETEELTVVASCIFSPNQCHLIPLPSQFASKSNFVARTFSSQAILPRELNGLDRILFYILLSKNVQMRHKATGQQ